MSERGFEKRLARLEANFAKFKKIEQTLKKLSKDVAANSRFRLDAEKAFKDVKKAFHALEDKHKKVNKQLRKLALTDGKLKADIRSAKNTINRINKVFNANTLSKLRSNLDTITDHAEDLAKQGSSTLRRLSAVERSITDVRGFTSSVATSAKETSMKSQELDKDAKELKGLAKQYFEKTAVINSKLNAAISSVSDLNKTVEQITNQLNITQNRLALLDRLKEQADNQRAMISDLKRRLEYLDKVCAKTIVLE